MYISNSGLHFINCRITDTVLLYKKWMAVYSNHINRIEGWEVHVILFVVWSHKHNTIYQLTCLKQIYRYCTSKLAILVRLCVDDRTSVLPLPRVRDLPLAPLPLWSTWTELSLGEGDLLLLLVSENYYKLYNINPAKWHRPLCRKPLGTMLVVITKG